MKGGHLIPPTIVASRVSCSTCDVKPNNLIFSIFIQISSYQRNDLHPHARAHHEATMGLAGFVELGSRAQSSSSEPHRFGVAWHRLRTLCHKVAYRLRPHAPNHTKWSGASRPYQPLREERVGKAVPGLAHRVGAEWRGARAECSRTGRTRWTVLPPL